MRHLGLTALTLAALALSADSVSAQQGRGGGFGGIGMYLSNKGVQKEIKADEEQAKKLDALAAETREKMTESRSKLEGLEGDERRQKMTEINKEITAGVMTSLGSILKPEQLKRFEQVQLQARGAMAFADPKVAEAMKKMADLNKEIMGKVTALLTEDQKKTWKEMTGEPFEYKFEAPANP